jgi:hypothetical protein
VSYRRSNKDNKKTQTRIRRGYDMGKSMSQKANEFQRLIDRVQAELLSSLDDAMDKLKDRFSE